MSDIKKCFTSRFKDGYILEADYSQLEIVALAFLSGDKQLREEMITGVDLHTVRAAAWKGIKESEVTPPVRKAAKMMSFQLQYGSGAKNMATTLNLPVNECQAFIDAYYARYPDVKKYQDYLLESVMESRRPSSKRTPKGMPAGVGVFKSITGRRYVFFETDNDYYNPKWPMSGRNMPTRFQSTQIKNYPIQGFATGDIVPLVFGKVYRELVSSGMRYDALLVNTVHDSIVLDSKPEVVYASGKLLKNVMEDAPRYLKETFNIDFDLPLRVEVKYGRNWQELEVLEV